MQKINFKMIINAPDLIMQRQYARIDFDKNKDIVYLEKKRNTLLKKILNYALTHTEFYNGIKNPDDLLSFPIINKNIISQNFGKFISDEKNTLYYRNASTGGSTGEPFAFYNSMYADGEYQQKFWNRLGFTKGDIVLSIDGTIISETDIQKGIYWKETPRNHAAYGRYHLSAHYIDEKNIIDYINYIKELKPSFIRSYSSCLYSIARYINSNNISLGYKLKAVQTTSEVLFQYQAEVIENAFQCKLFMQYGHTETCVFGYTEDSSFKYICEPMYGYVEILDNIGKQVDIGETGEIVVTGFWNKIMPLIRYKTGDLGEYGGESSRGTIINKIYGRTQDYVVRKDGTHVSVTSLVMGNHYKAFENIEKWQIEQWEPGKIKIYVVKSDNYKSTDEEEIRSAFMNLVKIDTEFEYVDKVGLTKRGKSKLVVQHII